MNRSERFVDGAIVAFAATSTLSIAASQLAMALAGVVWLFTWIRRRRIPRPLPLLGPFAAFLTLSLVSAFGALDPGQGLYGIRSAWIPVLFFFVCVDRLRDRRLALTTTRVWLVAGGVAAVLGLFQTLALLVRPPLPMHWAWFRVRGTLSHYMTYAGILMLLALFALALLLFRRLRLRDSGLIVLLALYLAAFLLTQTRSAWLGFGAGLVLLLLLRRPILLLGLPVLALLVLLVSPAHVRDRVLSLADLRDTTLVQRFHFWESGVRVVRDHPLLGVGPENLGLVWTDYRSPDDPTPSWERFTHLHNNPIQIAAERGIPTLACWLWIWAAYFVQLARARARTSPEDRSTRATLAGAAACVVGFLVAGLFEFNFGDTEVVQTLMLVMALPLALASKARAAADGDRAKLL